MFQSHTYTNAPRIYAHLELSVLKQDENALWHHYDLSRTTQKENNNIAIATMSVDLETPQFHTYRDQFTLDECI